MKIPTFAPPVPGTPVARLTVDGLGLCVFNDGSSNGGTKLWEVAYLRRREHKLRITIMELDDQGETTGKVIPYPLNEDVKSFTISLTNGSDAHYDVYPSGGPADPSFDRTAENNSPHDLGWIIDIAAEEAQHGFSKLVPESKSGVKATLAEFRHSFFYTRKPGAEPVRLSPLADDDPHSPRSVEIGRSNEEVDGLLLASASGEIRFEFDPPRSYSINPLPYDVGDHCRYKIEIINEDQQDSDEKGGFVRGDFFYYYDVIEVDGEKQDLWARPRPVNPSNPPEGDCNVGKVGGGGSLRTLIS